MSDRRLVSTRGHIHLVSVLIMSAMGLAGLSATTQAEGIAMSEYSEAVGTFLTMDIGRAEGQDVTSRSLLTFTEGGQAFLIDANQEGVTGFGPYSAASGSWRGVSNNAGTIQVSAVVLHFTFATPQFPKRNIGRVDIDATIDTSKGTLSGIFRLYLFPIDGDPLGPITEEPALSGPISGQKVVVPTSG